MNNAQTRDQKQYIRMTQTPIGRLIIQMAIPTIISMLVSSIYNMADTYFVSQLGTAAAGAVGAAMPISSIIQAFGFTLGMGSGSWISRLLGEKKKEESESVAICAFVSSIAIGLAITVFGQIFLSRIMTLMGATETILPLSMEYARYILYAAPIMGGSFVLNNQLRSQGKAKFAMIGISSGAILNIALDPLFIYTFGMGVAGAAIATAVSQCIGFAVLLSAFLFKKSVYDLKLKNIRRFVPNFLRVFENGLPSLIRQGVACIATIMLNRAAGAYGDAPFAAMTIVGKVFMMVFSVGLGIGQGYMPVVGYNYGAKKFGRVRKSFRFTFIVGTITMTVLGAAMFMFAPTVIGWFVSDDAAVAEVGVFALRAQCIAMPFLSLGVVCNMTFQTIGRSWLATFLSSLRQGIFFVPLMIVLPRMLELTGVELTQAISDVLTFLVCIPFSLRFLHSLPKEDDE